MSEETNDMKKETEGLAWRVSLSILVGVGWLVFLVLWLFFYAKNYVWEKNVSVFLMSLLFLTGILGVPWAYWALKKQTSDEKETWKQKGFRWRVWVSIIVMLCVIIFLIYWFWVLAEPYDFYQNLAIFIVTFLIAGGLLAAMWTPWSMRYSPERHYDDEEQKKH
jgi:archaellum biogenesis protein FlaJ (TadC family)